ncbi:MAG TPA: hypothetical protein V6D17_20605 [Candidatus Obscuribacterales bacterium]
MTTNELTYNLAGHVRHQGLPVAGVLVSVYDCYQLGTSVPSSGDVLVAQGKTGVRGEFTFAVRAGLYRVEVSSNSSTRFLHYFVPEMKVTSNTTCNISLSTGCILSGRVVTASGDTVSRCEVIALGIEPSSYRESCAVDSQGRYGVVLPRGKYHVACRSLMIDEAGDDEEMEADEDNGVAAHPGSVNTLASQAFITTEVAVVNFLNDDTFDVVLPEMVTLYGEVADVFGQPVVGAKVTVSPGKGAKSIKEPLLAKELDLSARCRTDENGRFEVRVCRGIYDVLIEPEETALLFSLRETGIHMAEDLNRKFTVSEGFRLRGQVIYEDQPLAQCLARVQGVDRKSEYLSRTDEQGQFSVAVPGGSYKLVVSAHPKDAPTITIDGAEYSGLAPWSKVVVVGGDTHVAVRLQQGTALLGRICDDSGQARPGVRVSVYSDSERDLHSEKAGGALSSGITDGEGRYCLFLSPGTYWLVVHKDFANARMVEIGSEPVSLDITWHGWCQLRFEVVGEDGQPIPRCRVAYAPYGTDDLESIYDDESKDEGGEVLSQVGLPRGYMLTGDDGILKLTVPSGVYTLRFTPPPDGSYEPRYIKQLSISGDITRRISLGRKEQGIPESINESAEVG